MTDYGTATDKIALLSDKLYRMFRGIIPRVDAWCWNLTPWTWRRVQLLQRPQRLFLRRDGLDLRLHRRRRRSPALLSEIRNLGICPRRGRRRENVEVAEEDRASFVLIASDRILNALNEYPVEVWGEALGAAVASLFTSKQDAAQIAQEDKDKAAEV